MSSNIQQIRNIGIIAHIDAGKTTVTERMLFVSGAKHRAGRVDSGTTETDDDSEEQERGITIYSACMKFNWKDHVINLLDTPGHVDFTAEVERCLRVLDGAVVVFSAREGVEAQSETVWRQADKYDVPRIVFVNKMDREGADFDSVVAELESRLEANPVILQVPVGQGPSHVNDPFSGVVDLIKLKMLVFDPEQDGKAVKEQELPPEKLEDAKAWREMLLEKLYEYSNEMMELALQEEPIPDSLIHSVIREATLDRQIHPVLCGSALHGMGIQPILDAVGAYLPSPLDRPPVEGKVPGKKEATDIRKPSPDEPFCGLVFKILPAKTGDLYWLRVYSGVLKANSRVLCPDKDKKENVSQLWQIHATKKERDGKVDKVLCGDIVAAIGPRHSVTGDTLCDPKHPIALEAIEFPETVLSMAIEPESTTERKKLAETLEMLKRQDPTFMARENEDTGQTLISGMGELHLEVIKHRLLRDFNLNVKVHKPRVNYRETIDSAVEVTGECHRQVAGEQLFARLKIRMEPFEDAPQVAVLNTCPFDELPQSYLDAAMDELKSRGEGGGSIGSFQLAKMKVTVLGGEASDEGSNELAFTIAAGDAFEKGLREAGPILLEPIMEVEIATPEEYMGEFIGDLQQRRATIVRTETRGDRAVIEAHAPLGELFGYSNALRSLSQGRASHSMEPFGYMPAPPEVADSFGL